MQARSGRSGSVIFLAEPTTGLDPRSRRTVWQTIRDLDRSTIEIDSLPLHLPDLDDAFLALTGGGQERQLAR